jgi:hypothetical protein
MKEGRGEGRKERKKEGRKEGGKVEGGNERRKMMQEGKSYITEERNEGRNAERRK